MQMQADLNTRVADLEKQLRLWRALTLIVVLGFMVLGAAAFAPQNSPLPDPGSGLLQMPARRVLSNSFVLAGSDGRVYAKMGMRDGSAVLNFYDEDGRVVWSAPPKVNTRPLATP